MFLLELKSFVRKFYAVLAIAFFWSFTDGKLLPLPSFGTDLTDIGLFLKVEEGRFYLLASSLVPILGKSFSRCLFFCSVISFLCTKADCTLCISSSMSGTGS